MRGILTPPLKLVYWTSCGKARAGSKLTRMLKLLSLFSLLASLCAWSHTPEQAHKFVGSFPKREVVLPFKSPDRIDWNYVPMSRAGVPYKKMTLAQREASNAFLKTWLSDSGWTKLNQIVALESVLGGGLFSSYDPNRYFFAFFGEPKQVPWGFRFEGHHLSLNFTYANNQVAMTPFFWGANPAKHSENGKTIEPMRWEQELALQLITSLSSEQRKVAIVSNDAMSEILLTPGEKVRALSPKGIAYSALDKSQQAKLVALVEVYLSNFDEKLRKSYAAVALKDPATLQFAWAGATEAGKGHYYRIQNEAFILEYDNTQNDANHIHTVWHDLKNNFGEDLLRAHYQDQHHK